jgi:DNA-binding HxlR family transcriptional regulator
MELVGRRWTASILRSLFAGCSHFTEIARTIPGISHRLLAVRLDELEGAGLVAASGGARPWYSLTEKGGDLRHALSEIDAWNQKWVEANVRVARC